MPELEKLLEMMESINFQEAASPSRTIYSIEEINSVASISETLKEELFEFAFRSIQLKILMLILPEVNPSF